jgi:3-phenylpropionate/trans-cinnamate dioxygenase ferredoxin reductase subunit
VPAAPVVIAGAGQGGFVVAASLRALDFDGPVTLVGGEPGLPYERPPLSKAVLAGSADPGETALRPEEFFHDRDIELIPDERVVAVELADRRVRLSGGAALQYCHLVLATGGENRRLEGVPGTELDGVMSLRTLAEAVELRQRLERAGSVAIVGAGFIGLEVAAVARAAGKQVHVFEIAQRPMGRVVSEPMSRFFADAHERRGVRLHFGTGIRRIEGERGRVTGVEATDGTSRPVDLVVVAIGIVPNDRLAAAAGLPVRRGVCVDERLVSADAAVSAVGDCARFPCRFTSRPVALESVQNACDQGRAVGRRIAGGDEPYAAVPWFWSDQGELRLQIAGLTAGADEVVVTGDATTGRFSALCFAEGRFLGVESVGRPGDHVAARKLLGRGMAPTPEEARGEGFDLKSWAKAGGGVPSR